MINKLYLSIIYSLNSFKTGQTSLEIKCSANKVYFSFVKYKFSNIGHFSFYKAFTKREINYLKITYSLNSFGSILYGSALFTMSHYAYMR